MNRKLQLAELYDGAFTEFYLFFGYDQNQFFLKEISYHYNAGHETLLKTLPLGCVNSFEELMSYIKSEFPQYISKPSTMKALTPYYLQEQTVAEVNMFIAANSHTEHTS